MHIIQRTLSRVAGLALILTGVALVAVAPASANDRAVSVLCTDHTTGTWRVSVTFSSVEVKADRPVTVTLGSESATLTEVGPNGTVTLHQDYPAAQTSADLIWSIVRIDYQNTGKLHLDQPAGCRESPATTETAPPTTAPATTAPPTTFAALTTPPPTTAPHQVEAAHLGSLPVTGGPSVPLAALGVAALLCGLMLVRTGRRRPTEI